MAGIFWPEFRVKVVSAIVYASCLFVVLPIEFVRHRVSGPVC